MKRRFRKYKIDTYVNTDTSKQLFFHQFYIFRALLSNQMARLKLITTCEQVRVRVRLSAGVGNQFFLR